MSVTRTAQSVQELRLLIAQLEHRGLAASHPEARALLERSRALLRQQQPGPRRLGRKLATLLGFAVDAAVMAALPVLILMALAGDMAAPALALALFAPAWAGFRLRRHVALLGEAARWLGYHLAWGWDWLAEAFSLRAMERLGARIQAREVMWGWRHHRRRLPRQPAPEDVAAYLALEYGPQAASEFHRATAAVTGARDWALRGGTRRNRAAERLAALRWSALITIFGRLAGSGALRPSLEDAMVTAQPAPQAPPLPLVAELPEHAARQADLREMIRRKRQDITAAFGWKLKSEAEIAQRDVHLAQLRAEIAALERELAELGG